MRPRLLPLLISTASLALAGCLDQLAGEKTPHAVLVPLPPPPPPPPAVEPPKCPTPLPDDMASDADRRAVEQAMQSYAQALRDGPPKSVAARFTAEGELQLPDLAALHGRKAIIDFLTPLASSSDITSVKMHTDLLEVRGPLASQWGTYDQDAGQRGKPPAHFHGRYAAVWRLEADGVWRIERLMMQPLRSGG